MNHSFTPDEPVVNTQEMSILSLFLERIRGEVFVVPWLLPVTVPVGMDLSRCNNGESRKNREYLTNFLFSEEVPACSKRC